MSDATLFNAISGDSLFYSLLTYNLGMLLPKTQNRALFMRLAVGSAIVFVGYSFVWAVFLHNFAVLLPQLPLPVITFMCGLFDSYTLLELRLRRFIALFRRVK